jgi:hypothetical protein
MNPMKKIKLMTIQTIVQTARNEAEVSERIVAERVS